MASSLLDLAGPTALDERRHGFPREARTARSLALPERHPLDAGGLRDEVERLVCGRIALDDIAVLAELRAAGVLERPRYLPGWLRAWQTLLPYFAFTSFMDGIDLGPVERHFQELLRVAADARLAGEGKRR